MATCKFQGVIDRGETVEFYEERYWASSEDGANINILRRYSDTLPRKKTPVVLVHGFAQNQYSWDLSTRSFQNYLVSKGFDTFNPDLRGHNSSREKESPYACRFEDYFSLDMPAIMAKVEEITGQKKCFLFGHSLGSSIVYAYAARHPEHVEGVVSIGGPTHFGLVSRANRWIGKGFGLLYDRLHPWPWLIRKIPYTFGDLASYFVIWNSWYFDGVGEKFPLAVWLPKSMEKEVTRERMIRGWDRTGVHIFSTLMRWFATPEGNFSDDGKTNYSDDLAKLDMPILFVVGNKDNVAPLHSIKPGYELCPSDDKRVHVFGPNESCDYGHIDLISGRYASRDTWPVMLQWLEKRSR